MQVPALNRHAQPVIRRLQQSLSDDLVRGIPMRAGEFRPGVHGDGECIG